VIMFSHRQNIPKKRAGVQSIMHRSWFYRKAVAATGVTQRLRVASLDPSYGVPDQ